MSRRFQTVLPVIGYLIAINGCLTDGGYLVREVIHRVSYRYASLAKLVPGNKTLKTNIIFN